MIGAARRRSDHDAVGGPARGPADPGTGSTLGLAALGGLLLALSFPPVPLAPLVFLALVPFLVALERLPPGPAGRWTALLAGLTAGAVYFGVLLYWLVPALLPLSALALPAWLGTVAVLAGLVGLFGWATHALRTRLAVPLPIRTALLWTSLEFVQAHLGPLAFPWLGLGTALAPTPALAGAADLVGARGLTAWIAGVNGALALLVLRRTSRRPRLRPAAAVAATLLALPALYGVARWATLDLERVATVALVQPDVPTDVRRDPARAVERSMAGLTELTASLGTAQETPDLVVWPEVAVPTVLERWPEGLRAVQRLSRRVGAPILIGTYGPGPAGRRFNSALLVGPNGPGARYDKRRLVPFIEAVPFAGAIASAGVPPARTRPGAGPPPARTSAASQVRDPAPGVTYGNLAPGTVPGLFGADAAGYGVLICYEAAFAGLARAYRAAGAGWLVNLSNDGWIGGDRPSRRTAALWQHPAHVVLRAVETRAGVVRVANNGASLVVDPLGRTHDRLPLFEPAVRLAPVYTSAGTTLFARWGDWVGATAAWASLLLLAAAAVRRRVDPLIPGPT